ncbi:MAG: hypothetical protein HC895_17430 [Leptolyngbyaceae cyanobacterium SM1_3_5]|nr:hypothetical protein [Leptolyngbyaceae cyanobacterium SM1_3_5]
MNIRQIILSVALIAASPLVAVSAFAAPIALDRSPVVIKQSGSEYSLCQAELRRRMGGARSIVSVSITDSTSSATTIRLTGQGTYSHDEGSRLQPFNFACVVNLEQSRVVSLSYNFISN